MGRQATEFLACTTSSPQNHAVLMVLLVTQSAQLNRLEFRHQVLKRTIQVVKSFTIPLLQSFTIQVMKLHLPVGVGYKCSCPKDFARPQNANHNLEQKC